MTETKPNPESTSLTVLEQREVMFYDDQLVAIRASNGQIYVSIRHLSEALGLSRQSQVRRIDRQQVLSKGHFKGAMMTPKGKRQANWLRVDLVPIFMTGIDTRRVKDEIRAKLEKYQEEAAAVLWEAFQEGRLSADTSFETLLKTDSPAVQAYKTFQALTKLARNQIMLEARVDSVEGRLEAIEATLGDPDRHITEMQATEISQAIRSIALTMSKRSGKNEYGRTWGEFYRKFGVSKYRNLPAAKFDQAMKWLDDWHQDLVGDSPF